MLPGGVCAVLEYEVPQMTDYVAEMTMRLSKNDPTVSPDFRKFVSGLLSSTRLPHTTILLGLNYFSRRLSQLSRNNLPFRPSDGQTWRMLTIGLLLGSKFLDDNTFQNRSWSEVSGISVSELNALELEWLVDNKWEMYVNLDTSEDFQAWLENWRLWREAKNLQRAATFDRLAPLAPIDTNVQRMRPYSQNYSGYIKTPSSRDSGYISSYDQQAPWHPYPTPHLTPPSAPDSGLNTPEYMSATGGGPKYNDWAIYNQYSRGYQAPQHSSYVSQPHVAPYHTPFSNHYGNQYPVNHWDNSVADCHDPFCHPHVKQPYFATHMYGQQIAA